MDLSAKAQYTTSAHLSEGQSIHKGTVTNALSKHAKSFSTPSRCVGYGNIRFYLACEILTARKQKLYAQYKRVSSIYRMAHYLLCP